MKLVANMHKLCCETCIETKWCNHCSWLLIVGMNYDDHVHYFQSMSNTLFTAWCQPHWPSICAWFLSLDNSQTELGLESFQPRNTSSVLHGFIHSHITSSDLVNNNAVSLYSQLNGLLTTLGPHSVRYIHHWKAVLRLSAHLADITQSGTI